MVDSTSPRRGEKVTYYSAVCLETGDVIKMEVRAMCNAETSVAFLRQLHASFTGPLVLIWDNAPAHPGEAMRTYLATPNLHLRLVSLPGYSPDYNADEAVWDGIRDEVTANTCLSAKANARAKVGAFFQRLADRREEVKRRCRSLLQEHADAFLVAIPLPQQANHADPTLALL